MTLTSAEASKLLKKLNADYQSAIRHEEEVRTFLAATGEDPESVRPAYSYAETRNHIANLTAKIRRVKHALNLFNTTHTVPGFDMTVDELLVYLPQLTLQVETLEKMKDTLPKVRERTYGSGTNAAIDYRYANYDPAQAEADYNAAYERLSNAQTALDLLNNTEKMEIDL